MDRKLAAKIISLKNADLALRDKLVKTGELGNGYNEEMSAIHNSNAAALQEIIAVIGYPSIAKVGKEASDAAWLVIQHAIEQPEFMKNCLNLLQKAVEQNEADPKSLAYLSDRIAVFEGKPQLYGTQFDWDEHGELSPNLYDDLVKVNERRQAIGLNSLEDQTQLIRANAKQENLLAPKDFEQREKEVEDWKKRVGWVNSF